MKFNVTIKPEGSTSQVLSNLEGISYAIGVTLRAAPDEDKRAYRKITAIKYLRQETNCGLYEAKALIEFAMEMLKMCEGNKLPAMLNPIE